MMDMLFAGIRKSCVVFCLTLVGYITVSANVAVETLTQYFDFLVTGNLESASGLWTESAVERSSRFGIDYTGISLKIDCSSPIVRDFNTMRNYLQPPVKRVTELAGGNFVKLEYSAIVGGKLVNHLYYASFDGDHYWLTFPQDYYCRKWSVRESEYFRIHVHPDAEKYLNPATLDEADRFVKRLADSLAISDSDLKTIREKKIEYFYCDSDVTVKEILGVRTKGSFDPASNDIISAFFPYNYEVAQLMVNYKLRHLPLFTHPLLGDGLAVYYAGRWGTAPSALMALGGFLYRKNIVEIDSLLTVPGFDNLAPSDIAYPVAGLFTAFLLDRIGQQKYMDLYLALSGRFNEVYALSDSTMRNQLLKACSKPSWESLLEEFSAFVNREMIEKAIILPGRISKGSPLVRKEGFVVASDKEWLAFEFSGNSSRPPTGNLLFGKEEGLLDGSSVMFEEQYLGNRPFEGYRYGIRFDKNEAGLYDYAANQLIAKYILGITPSNEYFDPEQNKITIKLKKSLVGDMLPSENDCKLIPL